MKYRQFLPFIVLFAVFFVFPMSVLASGDVQNQVGTVDNPTGSQWNVGFGSGATGNVTQIVVYLGAVPANTMIIGLSNWYNNDTWPPDICHRAFATSTMVVGLNYFDMSSVSCPVVSGNVYNTYVSSNNSTSYGQLVGTYGGTKYSVISTAGNEVVPIPPAPSDHLTQVLAGTFSPPNYSTTTSAVPIYFNYYVNSNDVVSPLREIPFTGLYFNEVCTELQSGNQVLPARFTQCIPLTLGMLDSVQTFSTTSLPVVDGETKATVFLHSTVSGEVLYPKNGVYNFAVSHYLTLAELEGTGTSTGSIVRSYANVANKCSPISSNYATLFLNTSFSIPECFSILFVPTRGLIGFDINTLKNSFLGIFPIGYVTSFVSIVSTSTIGSLPVISATIPNGVAGAGSHISLDMTHSIDFLLNATSSIYNNSSASSTQTFYQITSYYWNLIVYLMALLYIVRRIIGSHLVPKMGNKDKQNDN